MKCELKKIVGEDEPFLFEVYASTRKQEIDSWGWSSEQKELFLSLQWRAQQASYKQKFPNANHYVVLYENVYVGRCITEELLEYHHLIDLSILPSYQGKGIGTFIIKQLQKKAKNKDKPVILHVFHTNPARHLYERIGFQRIEADELYVKMQWQ